MLAPQTSTPQSKQSARLSASDADTIQRMYGTAGLALTHEVLVAVARFNTAEQRSPSDALQLQFNADQRSLSIVDPRESFTIHNANTLVNEATSRANVPGWSLVPTTKSAGSVELQFAPKGMNLRDQAGTLSLRPQLPISESVDLNAPNEMTLVRGPDELQVSSSRLVERFRYPTQITAMIGAIDPSQEILRQRVVVSDPSAVLVHLRDYHYEPRATPEDVALIERFQGQMHGLATKLVNTIDNKLIFLEGTHEKQLQQIQSLAESDRALERVAQTLMQRTGLTELDQVAGAAAAHMKERSYTSIEEMSKNENDPRGAALAFLTKWQLRKRDIEATSRRDAGIRFVNEGLYTPIAAETETSYRVVSSLQDAALLEGNLAISNRAMNLRDETIVSRVFSEGTRLSPQGSRIFLLKLGAAHDLTAEVQDWNKSNPDQQIALIEVSPRSLSNVPR
ncbi:MAG: hypothetical protein IT290_08700 [Deltaproteobacteria bacterium]|nr:hypothetical protein [Deltaproteobacteria bacterium]